AALAEQAGEPPATAERRADQLQGGALVHGPGGNLRENGRRGLVARRAGNVRRNAAFDATPHGSVASGPPGTSAAATSAPGAAPAGHARRGVWSTSRAPPPASASYAARLASTRFV